MTYQDPAANRAGIATLSILVTPDAANHLGSLFGGRLIALMDQAAFIAGSRRAGHPVVTAAVDHIDFHVPVHVGELLTIEAAVVEVGRTSLQVDVVAHAENLSTGVRRQATNGRFVMVAVGDDGRPVAVGQLV